MSIVGPSNIPSRYKLILPTGEARYVRCGADLVLTGLNMDVEADAHCPVCETQISFRIHRTRLEGLTIPTALLYVVERPISSGRISVECETTNLFDKKECLDKWTSNYHGRQGSVYTIQEYLQHRLAKKDKVIPYNS